jgi:hypothetical protein
VLGRIFGETLPRADVANVSEWLCFAQRSRKPLRHEPVHACQHGKHVGTIGSATRQPAVDPRPTLPINWVRAEDLGKLP